MKKLIVIFSVGVIAAVAIFFIQVKSEPNYSANKSLQIVDVTDITEDLKSNDQKLASVNADYIDFSNSIKEMKDKAKLIVTGKVVNQEQFNDMVVISTMEVAEKYKGKEVNLIKIHQLGKINDEGILKLDKPYLLFLGEQSTPGNSNEYYITGGEQGAFELTGEGSLNAYDQLMKEDIKKIKKENKNAKNEYEAVVIELMK